MLDALVAVLVFAGIVGTMVGAFALMVWIIDKSDERNR